MHVLRGLGIVTLAVLGSEVGVAQVKPVLVGPTRPAAATAHDFSSHPAVGSWFGKAIEVCQSGVAPSACANGQPAVVLFMTPTLTGEGLFVADDSLTLGGAPFGPHTTAHGQWFPTSSTEFTADYMFMLNPYPPQRDRGIIALRARWLGQVVDADTLVGWVNAYLQPMVPLTWTQLLDNEFPAFPSEATGIVTSPTGFVKDPALCHTAGCPLIFKFTIKRVAP